MPELELAEFAKKIGFHIGTVKRVFGADTKIPMVYPSKTERPPAEKAEISAKDAQRNYYLSGRYQKRPALLTWISVCSARKDILEAYYETEDESNEEHFAAKVMEEIFMKDIEKVSTLDDAREILLETPRGSGLEWAIFLRMYELYKKEEEVVAQ